MNAQIVLFTLLSFVLYITAQGHVKIDYAAMKKQVEFKSFNSVCKNNIKEASSIPTTNFSDAIKKDIKESIEKMKKLVSGHNKKSNENANGSDVANHLKQQCNNIKADIESKIEVATAVKPGTTQDITSFIKFCNDKVKSVEQEAKKQQPEVQIKIKNDIASLKKITSSPQVTQLKKSRRNTNFQQMIDSLYLKCTREANLVLDKIKDMTKPAALTGLDETYEACYAKKKQLEESKKLFTAPTGVRKLASPSSSELSKRLEKYGESVYAYEKNLDDNLKTVFQVDACIEDRPGDEECVTELYQNLSKPVPQVPDMLKELKAEYSRHVSIMGHCVQQADDIIKKHLPVNGKFPKLDTPVKKDSGSLKARSSKKTSSKVVDLPKSEEEDDDVEPDTKKGGLKKPSILRRAPKQEVALP
ncbi:Na/H exchange regulatory cofactor NHE-RF3 [Acrasis kona]|uniref:Na/H exchange regulatory cofactor NHE-RF3 n=1 Tax=Acrasis kona TaxID=1008807 RepID=A0AAW2YR28_9EUKA